MRCLSISTRRFASGVRVSVANSQGWCRNGAKRTRVPAIPPSASPQRVYAAAAWTVIRLLDGTRAYLHAVIDNFSRRILAWLMAETFAPVNSVTVLVEAGRGATPSETTPVVLADAGVEHVNAQVDELITTGVLRRVLAFRGQTLTRCTSAQAMRFRRT